MIMYESGFVMYDLPGKSLYISIYSRNITPDYRIKKRFTIKYNDAIIITETDFGNLVKGIFLSM